MKSDEESQAVVGHIKPSRLGRLKPNLKLPKRLRNIIILSVGLAALVTAGVGLYNYQNKRLAKLKSACTSSASGILLEASSFLAPEKSTELKPIVEKIRALPNYDKDPNCLNVVVIYYINTTDPKNAREMFDKLTKVYNPKRGFADVLKVPAGKDIDQLRTGVEFVEKLDQEFRNNTFFGPEV